MDAVFTFVEGVESIGIHRGGWIFVSLLMLVPALVSGNMVQMYLSEWLGRRLSFSQVAKPLLGNLVVLFATASIIATAIYIYTR